MDKLNVEQNMELEEERMVNNLLSKITGYETKLK